MIRHITLSVSLVFAAGATDYGPQGFMGGYSGYRNQTRLYSILERLQKQEEPGSLTGSSATDVRSRQLIFGSSVRWLKLSRPATDKTPETNFPIPTPGLRQLALPVPLLGGDDAKCEPEVVGRM